MTIAKRLPTISVTQQDVIKQLREQNASLIASLKQMDVLFEEQDRDRSVKHVEHVLRATLAVVDVSRCDALGDPNGRLAQALAELDRAKGAAK